MKRKLNYKARRALSIFTILIVVAFGGFGYGVYTAMAGQQTEYPVSAAAAVYDTSANKISMTSGGTVSRTWSGEWKLKLEDGSSHKLGENTVIFDDGKIKVLGGGYKIVDENTVERISSYAEVDSSDGAVFYKLADRRYLLVADNIIDNEELVQTKGYLYVVMDKAGNALLLNNEMCAKTLNATILDTGEYTFDIANEILYMGLADIDCKKVIGTSNEYDKDTDVTILREKAKEREEKGYTSNPEEVVLDLSGGKGGTGGTAGNGGIGGVGGIGGIGGQGGDSTLPNVTEARITMNMYSIVPNNTSLTIYYNVNDPYGQLGDVYFKLTNMANQGAGAKTYPADIDGNQKTIYNLEPNTKYKIEFCEGMTNTVKDTQYAITSQEDAKLVVTGMSRNHINFSLTTSQQMKYGNSTSVQLKSGGNIIGRPLEIPYNELSAAAYVGYSGSFIGLDLGTADSVITLELVTDGRVITSVSINNSYAGSTPNTTAVLPTGSSSDPGNTGSSSGGSGNGNSGGTAGGTAGGSAGGSGSTPENNTAASGLRAGGTAKEDETGDE